MIHRSADGQEAVEDRAARRRHHLGRNKVSRPSANRPENWSSRSNSKGRALDFRKTREATSRRAAAAAVPPFGRAAVILTDLGTHRPDRNPGRHVHLAEARALRATASSTEAAHDRPNASPSPSEDALPAHPSPHAAVIATVTAIVSLPTVAPVSQVMFPGANGFGRAIWASGPTFFLRNRNGLSATSSTTLQAKSGPAPANWPKTTSAPDRTRGPRARPVTAGPTHGAGGVAAAAAIETGQAMRRPWIAARRRRARL